MKALQDLIISNYNLKTPFTLKLFNLKRLQLSDVNNISLDESNPYNIVKCVINESSINQPNELINFPYLEDFRLFSSSFNEYINFKNLKKLKVIYTESSDLTKIKERIYLH